MTEAVEKFDPNQVPHGVVRIALDNQEDITAIVRLVSEEFPAIQMNNDLARDLVKHVTRERELDALASTPTGIDVVDAKLNKIISEEVDMLILRQRAFMEMLSKFEDDSEMRNIKGDAALYSKDMAVLEFERGRKRILELKKAISEAKKAEAAKDGGVNVNMQIALPDIASGILENIRAHEVEAKVVDAE